MRLPIWTRIASQAAAAIGMLLLGIVTCIVAFSHQVGGSWLILAVAYAAALVWYGIRELRIAASRGHGVEVERRAFKDAVSACGRRGLVATRGAFKPGIGDVDLIVSRIVGRDTKHPEQPWRVAVEIKSYKVFSRRDVRLISAAEQVRRAAQSLSTDRVLLWLPNATPSLLQSIIGTSCAGVTVILGEASRLARKADLMLQR
ncbi:hypothetical protein AB7849_15280 [Rhodanobacter sp. 115]|uniref:hypothetical protein n=1 Tax=Rhodanobacter sp. FW021-MT20 TaxID=1162282 RepID=UPI0034E4C3EB